VSVKSEEELILEAKQKDDAHLENVLKTLTTVVPAGGDAREKDRWDELEGLRDEYRVQMLNKAMMVANQILDLVGNTVGTAKLRDQIYALDVISTKVLTLARELSALKPGRGAVEGDLASLLPAGRIRRVIERVREVEIDNPSCTESKVVNDEHERTREATS